MSTQVSVFHADVVGSLLRPHYLVEARNAFQAGRIPKAELTTVENKAIDQALRLQEEVGLDVVTDGEFRRGFFFDQFARGLDGINTGSGLTAVFHNKETDTAMEVPIPYLVTEKVRPNGTLEAIDEFLYTSAHTDRTVKVTLPGPTLAVICAWHKEHSRDAYPDWLEFAEDVTEALCGWITQLGEAGCRYIQIDEPNIAQCFADAEWRQTWAAAQGIEPDRLMEHGMELLGSLPSAAPAGTTVGLHVCKGNGTQSWIAEGGYDDFAGALVRSAAGYDVYHFEYDDERSGTFEALKSVPDDKVVVLGLVSTKWTTIEDMEMLRGRVDEAAQFHPKENLAISTQCGFASAAETAEERKITDETQLRKLQLVVETAREIWG